MSLHSTLPIKFLIIAKISLIPSFQIERVKDLENFSSKSRRYVTVPIHKISNHRENFFDLFRIDRAILYILWTDIFSKLLFLQKSIYT